MAGNSVVDLSESNGGALVGTAIAFLVMSWISVALRTYTRAFIMKGFQLDDWFMLIAQLIFTASCAFILAGVKVGLGRHNKAITDTDHEVLALMWQALATATYVIDMMFIKLSIGVFLLRVSVQKVYRYILHVSLAVIAIWSTVIFVWDIFQCAPVQKQWDYRIDHGHCVSAAQVVSAAYAISVMTILSDWLYALLPIPMLWNVKMTNQAKTTVIVILGLGIFASIATLIRLSFLSDLEDTDDILFAGTDAMVWTLVEPGVAIVAASLATIRPLLRAMRVRGFDSTDHTYGTGRSANSRTPKRASAHPGAAVIGSAMPGYGPDDVSLHDVERTADKKQQHVNATTTPHSDSRNLIPRNVGLSFGGSDQRDRGSPRFRNGAERRPSDPKSEVYVIEGNRPSPTWSGQDGLSLTPSLEQIHQLDAQNQGTGFDGRR